jgi:hypothetical protein
MNISLKVEMAFFLPKALHFSERFLITVYELLDTSVVALMGLYGCKYFWH